MNEKADESAAVKRARAKLKKKINKQNSLTKKKSISKLWILIVDPSKCVKGLGKFPLPVEVEISEYEATLAQLKDKEYSSKLRETKPGVPFVTDNENYIIDIQLWAGLNFEKINEDISSLPGVLCTGYFDFTIHKIIIGQNDGTVVIK